jgi:hypothetical protein
LSRKKRKKLPDNRIDQPRIAGCLLESPPIEIASAPPVSFGLGAEKKATLFRIDFRMNLIPADGFPGMSERLDGTAVRSGLDDEGRRKVANLVEMKGKNIGNRSAGSEYDGRPAGLDGDPSELRFPAWSDEVRSGQRRGQKLMAIAAAEKGQPPTTASLISF